MDLLPTFRGFTKESPAAASWLFGPDLPLKTGFASASALLLVGFYAMARSKPQLAFMVTTEEEAMKGLVASRPGMLIVTQKLERGSALTLVERAPTVVQGLRSILIVEGGREELVAAGRSRADAVVLELECFGASQPLVALSRALALGQPYRSPSVMAALEAEGAKREPWRDGPPPLNRRELDIVHLLAQGLDDRQIAERLAISHETVRGRVKVLRRKLGASTRAEAVAKALRLGLAQPGER
ncbi:MAG: LuxR C-terminal-related transcriptional regulator [Cyanobacteriota bacterium]|nr:LuxR C-terminal-related transcriptional regulator [Cyanobacteriota bacterium]